jgi:flagellar hook-length control protein FliK
MSSDGGRVKVTLSPAELGDVDLEIVVRGQKVEVVMVAERAEVQQLLQSRGEEIKSALVRQDMKVESFQVLLQDRGEGNQQQSAAWTAMDEQRRGREKGNRAEEREREMTPLREEPALRRYGGAVSIFA